MPIKKAGVKTRSASSKAAAPKRPASKAAASPKKTASERAGAKFGGVSKRGNQLHRIGESRYRDAPFFKNPKLMAAPRITLEQAYRATDLPEIRTVKDVQLVSVKKAKVAFTKGPLKGFQAYRARTYTMNNRHRHEVLMLYEPDDSGALRADSRIVINCSCRRLRFQWEYANAKVGLSFIYYSNGQPPVIKNPGNIWSTCKHSLRLASYLLRKRADKRPRRAAKQKAKP